jgi:synaptobrevin family protein YKT6
LEDLVERSGELSSQSKLFYKQAKRTNSCCSVV